MAKNSLMKLAMGALVFGALMGLDSRVYAQEPSSRLPTPEERAELAEYEARLLRIREMNVELRAAELRQRELEGASRSFNNAAQIGNDFACSMGSATCVRK